MARLLWQDGDNGGAIENAANWSPAAVPGAGDIIEFGNSTADNFASATGATHVGEMVVQGDELDLEGAAVQTDGVNDLAYGFTVGLSIYDGGWLSLGAGGSPSSITTDHAEIGTLSPGTLYVLEGSSVTATTANIGFPTHSTFSTTSQGIVFVDGVGSSWHSTNLTLGFGSSMIVNDGAVVTVDGTLDIAGGNFTVVSTLNAGTITVDEGTLTLDDPLGLTGAINLGTGSAIVEIGIGNYTIADAIKLGAGVTFDDGITRRPTIATTSDAPELIATVTGALSNGTGVAGALNIQGNVVLAHAGNSYSGGTWLFDNANLTIAATGAAGTGAINFFTEIGQEGSQNVTLAVAQGVSLANTIQGFATGDKIDLLGTIATASSWSNGVLTLFDGTTQIATLKIAGSYSGIGFQEAGDGNGGTIVTYLQPPPNNPVLTTGVDSFTGTAADDTVIAAGNTLNAGDMIDGAGGTNTLLLQGGGSFRLDAPATLANFQIVDATEGGKSSDQQNVTLHAGTSLTINVAGGTDNPSQPWLNSIVIHGADNADTINLGPGYDTVILGSANETINGGSGISFIFADAGMLNSAHIHGGTRGSTLDVTGAGQVTMSADITNIRTIILPSFADGYSAVDVFLANGQANLTIQATGINQELDAGGAFQTLIAAAPSSVTQPPIAGVFGGYTEMVGSTDGNDTFKGTLLALNEDTIFNFWAAGDAIDVSDVAPGAVSLGFDGEQLHITNTATGASSGIFMTDGNFTTAGFQTKSDGHGGTLITYKTPMPSVVTLTTGIDTISALAVNSTVIAPTGTLNPGDAIDGGGQGTLVLQGGGSFHLDAPSVLTGLSTVTASEGGTAADRQNITLRAGTALTIDVAGSSDNPGLPWLNTVNIHGANNFDTIDLGAGYDTVTLGGANETVDGGAGISAIFADASYLGTAHITGGARGSTLYVTGSGTATMDDLIANLKTVQLVDSSINPSSGLGPSFDFTANNEAGLTIMGNSGADTITAGGANQTIVEKTHAFYPSHVTGNGNTLVGSTAGSDTFKGALLPLSGDTIENFSAAGDAIDITDTTLANLSIDAVTSPSETQLFATNSASDFTATITLGGSFDAAGFHLASDGHGGSLITYTAPVASAALKLSSAMASFSAGSGAIETSAASDPSQAHSPLLAPAPTSHG